MHPARASAEGQLSDLVRPDPARLMGATTRCFTDDEFVKVKGVVLRVERIEQRFCVFQIGGIEALGEPAVDRRE